MLNKLEILKSERERLKNQMKLTFTDVEIFVNNRKSEIKIFKLNNIITLIEESDVNIEYELKMFLNLQQNDFFKCEKNNNITNIIYYDALSELVDFLLNLQKQC